ncbi:CHAT domain-containing protein [Rubrobacter marinus]|uniref:CHAT domain-containing protein n=1 Tax=Rubrobacter marinus TaxID=2653852 RepID=A0A6G8Q1W0_9ACTN|nr:CHAT domain-containing protein [Rubrobacter marinus]QIN80461.1 CHAT domain-containing protein [Rubrobacter marinus]
MAEPSGNGVAPAVVEELLALPTPEGQAAFLRGAGLLNAEGLSRLLDVADDSLGSDPARARRIAELCVELAERARAPSAVPRANYIRAGSHNANGEFEKDLLLTRAAHDGYVALGMNLEAVRTNVGKMDALLLLGRYQEALDAGRAVLDALDGKGELALSPTGEQRDLLAALVNQNLGVCHEYMGRYEEALGAYASAEERYQALGMTEHLGEILGNRGNVLWHLGRGSEALEAHEAAARIFGEAGLTLSYAKTLVNIGAAHLRLGNYTRSLNALTQARRPLDSLEALADKHLLLRHLADAYLALNLYSEALAAYRESEGLLKTAGWRTSGRRRCGHGLGLDRPVGVRRGRGGARRGRHPVRRRRQRPAALRCSAGTGLPARSSGDREAALALVRRALDLISGEDLPVQLFYSHLRLADLLTDAAEAEASLQEARRLADRLALPQLRYRSNERLGRLRRLQGRDEEARALLEAAVEEIERLRGTVAQDAMRASFLRDKTAAYEGLLQVNLDRGEADVRRAFAVAERAKSRGLVDLLVGVAEKERGVFADPESEGRLRALQADLNATYNELLGIPADGEHQASPTDLHARAAELEREISLLRLQVPATAPDPFVASEPLEDTLGALSPDVTLVAYHVVGDEIMAFVNARGRVRVARHLGSASAVQRLLRRLMVQWDRIRLGAGLAGRHMALLERSARQVLAALYAEVAAPLEPFLEEAESLACKGGVSAPELAVVPHGLLHQVPFHALFDGERYLIERFEVSYAPSATVYALCQERVPADSGRALVLGVEDPLIPAAMLEARAVAEQLPGAEIRDGSRATLVSLRSEPAGCDALHLACHGLLRSDNPMFSSLKLHDGWLTAADAMDLDLPGALVVLSACESGRNEVIGGDEVIGLTRAFLGAGAATLVVSLWLVQDETTASLMRDWYRRLREGEGRAAALRAAQLEIKKGYPHPYYWAPFVLTGKR